MRSFKDAQERNWNVPPLDPFQMRAVRAAINVNLSLESTFGQITQDKLLAMDVLGVICKAQCAERKVSAEEFQRLLCDPDVAEDAHNAIILACVDFFPRAKREAFLRMYALEQAEIAAKVARLTTAETPETARSILNGSAGSSPGLPASTLLDSDSAS